MTSSLEAPAKEPLSSSKATIVLEGVARRYPARRRRDEPVAALEGVDLEVREREVLALVGPSGCGKSTLLEVVAGLQDADEGVVSALGAADAQGRRRVCAYMPQRDLLLPWRDALGNAALALECRGVPRAQACRRAAPLFERFGLARFERARPAELSGGMRQRVAFLRTLLAGRPVLLLDEPFAALDAITRAEMQEWLAGALADEPRTAVIVTHDVREALILADRVAVLSARPGRVVAELDVPEARPRRRREVAADPVFAALEQRAMEALGC
ncbi:MAG: ABC transporter ATP-binding protein [Actinobacteria bacterium]|nr:ABC transporter ATP-binding protein [Actinomycetota bacterium]